MGLLQQLLGGGQQQEYQDFVNRYDQGAPYEGITGQEALNRYQQIAPQLPPDVYQQSAQEAFSRMSPQERMQLGQYLMQGAQQQGINFPDMNRDGIDDRMQDPNYLAQMAGQMHQQQPGLMSQILGGGGGGGMMGGGNQMGGGGQMGGGNIGNMLDNPIAKAALAGVAAMAAKRFLSQR